MKRSVFEVVLISTIFIFTFTFLALQRANVLLITTTQCLLPITISGIIQGIIGFFIKISDM